MSGEELEVDVLRVAHGGVFVASHAGRVVFVPDVLPGERGRIRLTDDRPASFLRAETLAVTRPSPDRVQHVWAAASLDVPPEQRAGGAEFGHIAPARQRSLKAEVLTDALTRIGRRPVDEVAALGIAVQAADGHDDGTRSRTRLRLHPGAGGRLGPYAARSRRAVLVDDLPLATVAVERAALAARARGRRPVDVVEAADGDVRVLSGPARGTDTITERVGARTFRLEAEGFWQVHPAAATTLTRLVRDALGDVDPDADNLDLYGGVGLFAAAFGDAGGVDTRITTVEADARAGVHAAANLADLTRARAVTARTEAFLDDRVGAPPSGAGSHPRGGATVLLDPPRSGAGFGVVDRIVELSPDRVVYVACDPVALARDAGRFAEHGWRIETHHAVDLFPNTHHLEAVAAFRRT